MGSCRILDQVKEGVGTMKRLHKNPGDEQYIWKRDGFGRPSRAQLVHAVKDVVKTWLVFGLSLSLSVMSASLSSKGRDGRPPM